MSEDQDQPVEPTEAPVHDDPVPVIGALQIVLTDKDGNVKEQRNVENLVVTVGKNAIADQILASPTFTKPTHMAVGTGSTAANVADTTLETETARVALATKTRSGNVVTYTATFPAGTGTGALTEAGIFDASSSGNMWNRVVYSVINKAAGDSLAISWTTTIG
jgi:hypothetical protein